MNKVILITRPKEQSKLLAQELQKKGYKSIIEPLFKIKITENTIPTNSQAFLVTSMNAIEALSNSQVSKNAKILAVGEKTAQRIEEEGFTNISFAAGSSESLRKLATHSLSFDKGEVIYLAGNVVTLDLAEELSAAGFKTQKIITYKIVEAEDLSQEIISQIKEYKINSALLYSKNTASIFHKLISKHNLLEYCQSIKLLCFSDKISDYCLDLGFKKVGSIKEIIDK